MADELGVPGGFIKQVDEFRTVHHCDIQTAFYRIKIFEHFHSGQIDPLSGIASIFLPDATEIPCNDYATPLIFNYEGVPTVYAHLYSLRGQPTIANAFAFCNPDRLTPRQLEVFDMLLKGASSERIARTLGISERTLEKHAAAVYSEAQVTCQFALIERCSRSEF